MFNLFGKKKEKEAAPVTQAPPASEPLDQGNAYKALAARFEPEELTVLAVTGTGAFGGTQLPDQELWLPPSSSPPGWRRMARKFTGSPSPWWPCPTTG